MNTLKTLLIFFMICFIFIIQNINNQENFITWYLPFYNQGTIDKVKDFNYITSNVYLNQLEYDYINRINIYLFSRENNSLLQKYYSFLFKTLLAGMKLKNLYIKPTSEPNKLLTKVNEDNINLSLVSAPYIINSLSTNLEIVKNINSIIAVSYNYIFIVTNKSKQISSILELNGKTVNIGIPNSDEYLLGQDMIQNLNINQDFSVKKTYYDTKTSFSKLISGEIDAMIYTDLYPSLLLDKYILQDLTRILIFLPINGLNEEVFKIRHRYIEKVALDLNLIQNYLPVKIKNLEYNKFRPDLNTYRYPNYFICNKNASPRLSFQIVNSVINNLDLINKSPYVIKNGYNYLALPEISNSPYLPDHVGAKIYYNKVSVYTTEKSDLCKYYVGNAKCTPKRIEGAKIVVSQN